MPGLDEYAALTITPNGQQALILHGTVLSYEHEHGERLAQFEYLKRDGAEQEPMGANASRLNYKLVLMGEAPLTAGGAPMSAGQRYQVLVTAQRSQPRCLLVDPRLGRWQVGWSSIRASEEPQKAIDCIEISLSFVEDQIDQALAIEAQPTPQARANQAVDAYSIVYAATFLAFNERTNPSFQACVNASQHLADATGAFVNAALNSVQSQGVDPTLRAMLDSVRVARESYFTALDATLADSLDNPVSLVEFKHAAYLTEAASVELLIAIENLKPQILDYRLPTPMSLIAVLQLIYGADAQAHREEAERLNPFSPTVTIPAGTTLRLVAPTPRQ
jgi:hypothetical protein